MYEKTKSVVIIVFIISTIILGRIIYSNNRSIGEANNTITELRTELAAQRETIAGCRTAVGEIRAGLQSDTTELRDIIERLQEISAAVGDLEKLLYNNNNSSSTNDISAAFEIGE